MTRRVFILIVLVYIAALAAVGFQIVKVANEEKSRLEEQCARIVDTDFWFCDGRIIKW